MQNTFKTCDFHTCCCVFLFEARIRTCLLVWNGTHLYTFSEIFSTLTTICNCNLAKIGVAAGEGEPPKVFIINFMSWGIGWDGRWDGRTC